MFKSVCYIVVSFFLMLISSFIVEFNNDYSGLFVFILRSISLILVALGAIGLKRYFDYGIYSSNKILNKNKDYDKKENSLKAKVDRLAKVERF